MVSKDLFSIKATLGFEKFLEQYEYMKSDILHLYKLFYIVKSDHLPVFSRVVKEKQLNSILSKHVSL